MKTFFTPDMIKGNDISHTKRAAISHEGTAIIIHGFKNEPLKIWVQTPTSARRIADDIETTGEAVFLANSYLVELYAYGEILPY
jgi:hypothetical protein